MDLTTIITSVVSTLGITTAGAWWLGRTWIEHRLSRAKAEWDGEVRRNVDEYLAVRAAEIQYELEAKKRLYEAIGPLRFQLLLACRDLASRIRSHGASENGYSMDPNSDGYYGRDTLFRLVRPLALAELIERQMAYADFAIDPDAVALLQFKMVVAEALSGDGCILNHPDANWDYAEEHLFRNSIAKVSNAFIVPESDGPDRVLQYHELDEVLSDKEKARDLGDVLAILGDFKIKTKPIFWLRLVCYGHVCASFLNRFGVGVGLSHLEYDSLKLVERSEDEFIQENLDRFSDAFNELTDQFVSAASTLSHGQ